MTHAIILHTCLHRRRPGPQTNPQHLKPPITHPCMHGSASRAEPGTVDWGEIQVQAWLSVAGTPEYSVLCFSRYSRYLQGTQGKQSGKNVREPGWDTQNPFTCANFQQNANEQVLAAPEIKAAISISTNTCTHMPHAHPLKLLLPV